LFGLGFSSEDEGRLLSKRARVCVCACVRVCTCASACVFYQW